MRNSAQRRDEGPIDLSPLMDWALTVLVACAVGLALHFAIRLSGLRWTWALVALAPVPLLTVLHLRSGLALALASGTAAAVGFGWYREDLDRRGEEAQSARERLGPLALARSLLAARRLATNRVEGDRLALGQTQAGRIVRVPFGARQGVRALIVGAPGFGKTVTTAAIAAAYIAKRMPVVCVDPKGDPSLREWLHSCARRSGARFVEWSAQGPATYNPLGRGGPTEVADKTLSGELWSEPHYLRQAQRYLGWAVRAMSAAGEAIGLRSLAAHLDPDRLEALSDRLDERAAEDLRLYLDSLSARQRAELGGVRDRISILAESDLGPWLEPGEGPGAIDLARAWREDWVVYFQLDSDRYPLASEMVAAAIVSDLVALTGELQQRASLGLVAIDEFAAVGARDVLRILSRSRSAGISVCLATQGLADLDDSGTGTEGGGFQRRVLTQLDFVVAHRQPEPESAEILASMSGTRPVWATTRRVDSRLSDPQDATGSRIRQREFARHPDEFKSLGVGQAIVVEQAQGRGAQRARVWLPPESTSAVAARRGGSRFAIDFRQKGGSGTDSKGVDSGFET